MSYYFAKTFTAPFPEAVSRARDALSSQGFGVISEIDIQATLQAKLGAAFRPYVILGACNPKLAHEALQLEDKVGLMLPCNVIVQDLGGGQVEVAAVDPVAAMGAIDNSALKAKAGEVAARLKAAIDIL